MQNTLVIITIMLALGGCAAKAPERAWTPTSESASSLESARAACEKQALEHAGTVPGQAQGLAASAAGGIFVECMRKAGWELKAAPQGATEP